MFRWLTTWAWLVVSLAATAQDTTSVRQLRPVMVRGVAPERFMAGLKVQRADSALVDAYRYQSLAELLALQAPVQFKSYGPGQLTTVGLRGTSANHTAVLWNGININVPSLGQTDFSTIPVAGFDHLSIQYGSAASCVGSDAVGGSILLNTTPAWQQRGLTASLGHRQSAWGSYQTQAGARYANRWANGWQLSGKTHLYNGFLAYKPAYTERNGYLVEPSQTGQRGLIQDLFLRDSRNRQLSLNLWFTDTKLTISPSDPVGRETTQSGAYRALLNYEFGEAKAGRFASGHTLLRLGYIRDLLDYGRGSSFETNPSRTRTDRLLLRAEHEIEQTMGSQHLSIRLGAEGVRYEAQVDGYVTGTLHEYRSDLYALIRYQLVARLVAALNLRQAFVTRFDPPFTPSAGLEYRLLDGRGWRLDGRANVARSYRVPTLNERYWRELGNPNIRPERGFTQDVGLTLSRTARSLSSSLSLSAFRNHMYDWTYWNPSRGYRVENLQEVLARGLEAQLQLATTAGVWRLGGFGQYAYTRSSQLAVYDPYAGDVIGKQLVYLPLHTASATAFAQRGQHRLTLTWQGVDRRPNTFDNSSYLPPYTLVNLLAQTGVRLGHYRGQATVQVDNLFNEFYLNVKRNVMPGRTVALTLVLLVDTNSPTQ